jgi:hypothetical protein
MNSTYIYNCTEVLDQFHKDIDACNPYKPEQETLVHQKMNRDLKTEFCGAFDGYFRFSSEHLKGRYVYTITNAWGYDLQQTGALIYMYDKLEDDLLIKEVPPLEVLNIRIECSSATTSARYQTRLLRYRYKDYPRRILFHDFGEDYLVDKIDTIKLIVTHRLLD